MEEFKTYFAFISYQRQDEEWAKWLAHELEHYHFPTTLNGHPNVPKDLRPIFRDIDELSAGNLPSQIHKALSNSKHLIVICSPRSAQSKWVNKEIEEYISLGRINSIFPFIIDGKAYSKNVDEECFPPALRNLPKEDERLGGNISELGRDAAVVKIVAGMLGLEFDTLWQRYEREKAEEERKIRAQRDDLLKLQSRYIAKSSLELAPTDAYTACYLALQALPKQLLSPNRPYVPEAERALRTSLSHTVQIVRPDVAVLVPSPDGRFIAAADKAIHIFERTSYKEIITLYGHKSKVTNALFTPDGKRLISTSTDGTVRNWDIHTGNRQSFLMKGIDWSGVKLAKAHSPWLNELSISKNGKIVAACAGPGMLLQNKIFIWEIQSGSLISTITIPLMCAEKISLSPTGETIAIVGSDLIKSTLGEIYIYNVKTGGLVCSKDAMSMINDVRFDTETSLIIAGDSHICRWNLSTNVLVVIRDIKSDNSVISIDSKSIYLVEKKTNTIRIFELETNELHDITDESVVNHKYIHPLTICKIIASCPSGNGFNFNDLYPHLWKIKMQAYNNRVVFGHGGNFLVTVHDVDPKVIILDASTGELIYDIWDIEHYNNSYRAAKIRPKKSFESFSISADDHFVCCLTRYEGIVHVCDLHTRKFFDVLEDNDGITKKKIKQAFYGPEGTGIFTLSYNGQDVALYKLMEVDLWIKYRFSCVEFQSCDTKIERLIAAPDGSTLYGIQLGKLIEWDISSGRIIRERSSDYIDSEIELSPDGKFFAANWRSDIYIIEIDSLKTIMTIKKNGSGAWHLRFAPDGNRIMSTSSNNKLKIWDIEDGVLVSEMDIDTESKVSDIRFDGREVIVGSYIYELTPLQEVIDCASHLLHGFSLSDEDKKRYYLE